MSKVYDFLLTCGTFFLSTVSGDAPECRPFGAVYEEEGKLYITTSPKKRVYEQMKRNGKVAITAIKHGTRDWVRIGGVACEVENIEIKTRMLQTLPKLLKYHSTPTAPDFAVFEITDTAVQIFETNR